MTRSFRPSITRILVELGETNMRCAILDNGEMRDIRVFKLAEHSSLEAAIDFYCGEVSFQRESRMGLLIALAAHLQDGYYHFKHNPSWNFRPEELLSKLSLASVHFLNDLESHAYAVMLGSYEKHQVIFEGHASKDGPMALVAPGTGLGFSLIYPEQKLVQPTLGAHMHFSGLGKGDEIFPRVADELKYKEPIFEDIVSGAGLKILREKIGSDADDYFGRVLGRFCHYVALFGMTKGGIFITGGLIPALMKENRLNWDRVRETYMIHNVLSVTYMLQNVPWTVVDDPWLGLKGLVAWAKVHIDT